MPPEPPDDTDRLKQLSALVQRRVGLDMHQTGIGRRLAAEPDLPDPRELAPLAEGGPEWQHLLDRLLVPETYLFRDPEQLDLAARVGLGAEALQCLPNRELRIWSAGCCTGEEAYSLAVLGLQALKDAGHARELGDRFELLDGWRLDVLGTDISDASLTHARAGRYATGALSPFRAALEQHLPLFPQEGGAERSVRADIRRLVRFRRESLLATGRLPIAGCHVVACRNVLVYLSQSARRQALGRLTQAVAPGGLLLLGPVDPQPSRAHFAAVWGPDAVVYRRTAVAA